MFSSPPNTSIPTMAKVYNTHTMRKKMLQYVNSTFVTPPDLWPPLGAISDSTITNNIITCNHQLLNSYYFSCCHNDDVIKKV